MKKRALAPLLCALLLTPLCGAAADAGGPDDPLVSLSYVEDTFLPRAREAVETAAAEALAAREAEGGGTFVAALSPGEGFLLAAGQRLALASGELKIYTASGEAADVTAGGIAGDGAVSAGTRIVVCEDGVLYADAVEDALLKISASAAATEDGCPFRDVGRGSWYHDDVAGAFRRGLVDGVTPADYAPYGTLTVAQCVKLAACMRQLWRDGAVTLEISPEGAWYGSYVDYAKETGILTEDYPDYDAAIGRAEFVRLFYRALPATEYDEINDVPDGAIPDVAADGGAAAEIYAFYRAGILVGYTGTPGYAEHAFGPESTITRAEMAAIMERMFNADARIGFEI